MKETKEEIINLLEDFSPKVESDYKPVDDPIIYEVSNETYSP